MVETGIDLNNQTKVSPDNLKAHLAFQSEIDLAILTKVSPDNLKAHLAFQSDSIEKKLAFMFKINSFPFFIILSIILSGIFYMFMVKNPIDSLDYWKLVIPTISTYLGYVFGKGNS